MKFLIRKSFKITLFLVISTLLQFSSTANNQNSTQLKISVQHPEWSYNSTIYEVNIRQFTKEGTFKAFAKHLPRLKKLGVDILWLMPLNPIGKKNRKGELGSYYSVRDYKGINPEFGNKDDFKNLVNEIHKNGMHVIIDWVANHSAWDNIWVKTHPDYYTKDKRGNFVSPVPDWTDVIDFDYSNKKLWNAMADAMKYWVKEFDIDGFRCDVAAMVPTEFWTFVRPQLDKLKHVFMLAEANKPYLHQVFDMTYNWQLKDLLNGIAKEEKNVNDIYKYLNEEKTNYPPDAFRMNFTSNHDENTWNGTVFERLYGAAEISAVFACLIPGMPMIYNGQEAGLNKRLRFFNKDTIEWRQSKFENIYKTLFHEKHVNQALFNGSKGGKLNLIKTNNKNIFAFERDKNKDRIIGIFNFSPEEQMFTVGRNVFKDKFNDIFTQHIFKLDKDKRMKLPAWGYKVLTNRTLIKAD